MKPQKRSDGRRRSREAPHAEPASEGGPALPAWKAFVVQFTRESGTQVGTFAGRIEHLNSGRRAHFGSGTELLATLVKLLKEIKETDYELYLVIVKIYKGYGIEIEA